jgi:hypothetical protein
MTEALQCDLTILRDWSASASQIVNRMLLAEYIDDDSNTRSSSYELRTHSAIDEFDKVIINLKYFRTRIPKSRPTSHPIIWVA